MGGGQGVEDASGGELTLDKFRKGWPVVLKQIKEKNIKAQAFLIESRPAAFDGEVLVIEFPEDKAFHKKRSGKGEKVD